MQGLFKLVANNISQRQRESRRRRPSSSSTANFWWSKHNKIQEEDDDEVCIDMPTVTLTRVADNDPSQQQRRTSRNDAENLGLLYNLARTWKFQALVHRAETHPYEACGKTRADINGDTALHWAVFGNPPLNVVEALLRASPEAASIQNNNKDLPLHVACSYRAHQDVCSALMTTYPDALAIPNGKGFWPIHILCDVGCSTSLLLMILNEMERTNNLDVVLKTDGVFGRTPLHIMNARKNLSTFVDQIRLLRSARQRERVAKESANWNDQDEVQLHREIDAALWNDFWVKSRALILAEDYHTRISRGKTNGRVEIDQNSKTIVAPVTSRYVPDSDGTINACLSINNCPPSLLEYALLVYRNELMKKDRDDHDNLPLHKVCSQYERPPKDMQWRVMEVLGACPEAAAVTNSDGKVPLDLFVNRKNCDGLVDERKGRVGWSEALRQLIIAYPVGLEVLNVPVGLYPLIIVKVCDENQVSRGQHRIWRGKLSDEDKSRTATFELLRGCPNILSSSNQLSSS